MAYIQYLHGTFYMYVYVLQFINEYIYSFTSQFIELDIYMYMHTLVSCIIHPV